MLTNTQVSKLCKAFPNSSLANIKLSKTQLHKISGFLRRVLGPLLKTSLSLTKSNLKLFFGLTVATTATDAAIQNKIFGSGGPTIIIWNEVMNDIMEIVKSLEDANILIKGVRETIEIKERNKKVHFSTCC